ncbi:hypothetical protein DIPPA_34014 [Diplonema papillatum]|nr:hypothetical protein DIPPA_34014 [Diplonema papillatum]
MAPHGNTDDQPADARRLMNRYDHPCGTYTRSPGSCCASKKDGSALFALGSQELLEDCDRGGVGGEAVCGGARAPHKRRPYTG